MRAPRIEPSPEFTTQSWSGLMTCHVSSLQHVRQAAINELVNAFGVDVPLGIDPEMANQILRPRWLPTAAVRISPPCKFCRSFVDPAEGFAPLPPEASPSPSGMPARTTRPLIGEASIADPSLSQDTVGTRAAARRWTSGSTPCTSPAPAIFGTCRIKRSIEQARSSETGSSSGAWRKRPRGSRRRATRALRPRARPPSPAAQQRETSDQAASRQAAKVKKIQTMARWP
jgi:hypothetical protein